MWFLWIKIHHTVSHPVSDSRIRRVRIKTSENQDPRAKWYQLLHLKCLPIRYERFWKGSESKFKLHYKPESWERWNLDTVPKVTVSNRDITWNHDSHPLFLPICFFLGSPHLLTRGCSLSPSASLCPPESLPYWNPHSVEVLLATLVLHGDPVLLFLLAPSWNLLELSSSRTPVSDPFFFPPWTQRFH